MAWTDERIEVLKKLWIDGLSASQIALELGDVTRNAVIGKVHRLGLSGRGKTSTATARARPQRPNAATPARNNNRPATSGATNGNAAFKISPETATETLPVTRSSNFDELIIPFGERANIMQLNEHTCRWPIGDPISKDFHFCGRRSDDGTPYCAHHRQIAYQPSSERRREKKLIAS